jgi:hypothetical protein
VRRAFLLGEGESDRKVWIENRLRLLAEILSLGVGGFAILNEHTSIKQRVDHVQAQGRTEDLKAAREGGVAESEVSAGLEESHWLRPIEDRRRLGSSREGMLEGFSLGSFPGCAYGLATLGSGLKLRWGNRASIGGVSTAACAGGC